MRALAAVAFLLVVPGIAHAADAPAVQIAPVARTNITITGQPIVVPDRPDVIVSVGTFPPGARLPEHRHPYPHYVYVLEGVLTVVNTETHKTAEFKAGEFFVEMQNTWHYGSNDGAGPVKLLVIDQVPAGTPNNLVAKQP
jgi:quercetin dioxygenase-like cupin family protein